MLSEPRLERYVFIGLMWIHVLFLDLIFIFFPVEPFVPCFAPIAMKGHW